MNVVGFDTSLPPTSACVVRDDHAFSTPPAPVDRLLGPARHSEELLPVIEGLLGEAGISWDELDSVAVGVGPGTFTGLRIGVATARALAQALGLALRPVSSLEALAAGAATGARLEPGRLVMALIDARRGQVFSALYRATGATGERGSADRRLEQEWEASVLDPEQLLDRVRSLDEPLFCAGDWAIESRPQLERAGAEVPPADCGLHSIDARQVCRLGMAVRPVPPDRVRPVYLRLPDAEVNRRLARLRGA